LKISPKTWKQVDPLFTAALELAPGERGAWLEGLRERQPGLAPIVEELLATHEQLERATGVETVPRLAVPPPGDTFAAGEAIGPFRLVRPLGRGGMGEVWLAEQADGRVARKVALKLPTFFEAGGARAERFRRERDILAKLEHPNIARLYDAGVTDKGQPWLAMEFVQGEPLDAHCAARSLSIRDRLGLMRQVLAAVAHAHRFLVVHRDLKPANILVDAGGQAHLLDFGIAKLLGDEGGAEGAPVDLTRLGGRAMTLRYAAPEQATEGAITTATDVYALGVILHELLAGASPYRAVREGRALPQIALVQEHIARPSSLTLSDAAARERGLGNARLLARVLSGDLDAILLKALRRDPADRYASAEQFDEDLRAHLESRPVAARAGTWRYLAGRYVRRHRVPVALGAMIVAMLAAGVAGIDHERRRALAERARAERHFSSVRQLANAFIFDVHSDIRDVPGTLAAQEKLVKTSLSYLDALAAESGGDAGLALELAAAYRRIAAIQGGSGGANKGEFEAALESLGKARRVVADLVRASPDDIAAAREAAMIALETARAQFQLRDPAWRAGIDEAARLASRAASLAGATSWDRAFVHAVATRGTGMRLFADGQSPELERTIRATIAALEAQSAEPGADPRVGEALVQAYMVAAGVVSGNKRTADGLQEAIGLRQRANSRAQSLLSASRGTPRLPAMVTDNAMELARLLSISGQHQEATALIDEVVAKASAARAAHPDPGNVRAALDEMNLLARAARVANASGDYGRAAERSRAALAIAAALPENARVSASVHGQVVDASIHLGWALLETAQSKQAPASQRAALLREACASLKTGAAGVAERRAQGVATYDDDSLRWLEAMQRRCDEAIRRPESPPAS